MYERHFGLKKRPFIAKVTGTDVFVGPQTATTMAHLKKALQAQDAVVTVSGPAGVGKTTLVGKALQAVASTHKSIRIGRMQLQGTDVLEFLLEELGVKNFPKGPIRQFSALRDRLYQLERENTRVVIAIEDAMRVGAESLAELEALTAADAGESGGAAIVLMGDSGLASLLGDPQLARLAQRVRQRQSIDPLCAAEIRGYLMHCFRLAGVDFEHIFESGSAALVHELSGGIPRMANNIVEGVLDAAAAGGLQKVPSSYVADVARKEFGLVAATPVAPAQVVEQQPVAESKPEPEIEPVTEPVTELAPEPRSEPAADPTPEPDPVIVFADETDGMEAPVEEAEIPELIQDTLPDLEILAPELGVAEAPTEEEIPELQPEPELLFDDAPEPEAVPEPVLVPEPAPEPVLESTPPEVSPDKDIPEWERDPTLAQLKPDLDALEKAMAIAQGDDEPEFVPIGLAKKPAAVAAPEPEVIPEITLDYAIQSRIENNLIDEPGQISPTPTEKPKASKTGGDMPEIKIPPRKAKKADAELEKIAAELAKAKTLEDVDDKLAETLFGEEFSLIAAQVVAKVASESANDEELALFDTQTNQMAQAGGSAGHDPAVAAEPGVEVSLATHEPGGERGMDLSASQRLRTVRALNAHSSPVPQELEAAAQPAAPAAATPPVATPEPIEDQINTSMTQTLKALNVRPPISDHAPASRAADDDDDDDDKRGFFSRFRRS